MCTHVFAIHILLWRQKNLCVLARSHSQSMEADDSCGLAHALFQGWNGGAASLKLLDTINGSVKTWR